MDNPTQPAASLPSGSDKFAEPRDVLVAARQKIERPEKWGQGFGADRPGTMCAADAILATSKKFYRPCCMAIIAATGAYNVTSFNDTHTHAEVLAAFDRAIEQCVVGDPAHAASSAEVA